MIPSNSNHLGLLAVALSFGFLFLILKIFSLENYDWLYAIPVVFVIILFYKEK